MADVNFSNPSPNPDSRAPPKGSPNPRPGDLRWDIIELLFFAYRDFVGDADHELEAFGFGRAHHRVMHFVHRYPGLKVADLLDVLRITKQSLGRVLKQLLDDDRRIRDLLSRFLCGEGYRVTTAMSASDARAKLLGLHFDLLILDVMMPGETGFDLARFIRTSSSVPIIMLTARHEAESRIEGLQIGADDYVAKPFEPRELVLRIGNILKRAAPPPVETLEQAAFGPYVYHLDRGELRQGDEVIHLTDREREMLRILAIARGETVPRSALTGDGTVNERAVDVQINRLRRKIERDPANPLFLQAVRGIGYRLAAAP